jgi:hypothetical protein
MSIEPVLFGIMRTSLLSLLLLALAGPASADTFYTLVSYECDQDANRIVITYRGAYNEEGENLVRFKSDDQWEPGQLIKSMIDDDHIGELETIHRTCRLADGEYSISIGPSPGNMNIQGRCGAQLSAWVEIERESTKLLRRHHFEGDCHMGAPVLTKVEVQGGKPEPLLSYTPYNEFYR